MKKSYLFLVAAVVVLLSSCVKEKLVDCNSTTDTFICFDNEGREATYARWNFDTVQTFNAFNIQGSYPAVPGTTGPWTTINITLVNTAGNMVMEPGSYTYFDFITNAGSRKFTFWVKRYDGEAQTPNVKNFVRDPAFTASLNILGVDGMGKLSGVFQSSVRNMDDSTEVGYVKYVFNGIELQ